MIGYLKPFTPELKLKHWEFYKSLYCSLCINTKYKFSNFYRLFINNDSIFLYLLFISTMDNIEYHFEKRRCIFHPINKTTIFVEKKYFDLFVEISFLISYIKIIDNVYDNKTFKYKLFKKLFEKKISTLNIIKTYKSDFQNLIKIYFEEEEKTFKKENFSDINDLINPFVNLLIKLLPLDFLSSKISSSLKIIINHLIKVIYILDAYEDFEDDIEKGKKNIIEIYFNNKYNYKKNKVNKKSLNNINSINKHKIDKNDKKIKNELKSILNYSFNIIKDEFEKLPINYNKSLLENFLFFSLPIKADELIFKENYFKSQYEKEKKYLKQIHEKW